MTLKVQIFHLDLFVVQYYYNCVFWNIPLLSIHGMFKSRTTLIFVVNKYGLPVCLVIWGFLLLQHIMCAHRGRENYGPSRSGDKFNSYVSASTDFLPMGLVYDFFDNGFLFCFVLHFFTLLN